MVIDRIIELDGKPVLSPKDWYKFTTCGYEPPKNFNSISILKQNLKAERCAIEVYNKLLKKFKYKDEISHYIILKILKDEIKHECDIETILEDIRLS